MDRSMVDGGFDWDEIAIMNGSRGLSINQSINKVPKVGFQNIFDQAGMSR